MPSGTAPAWAAATGSAATCRIALGPGAPRFPLWPPLPGGCPATPDEAMQWPLGIGHDLAREDRAPFDQPPGPGLDRWRPLLPPLAPGPSMAEGGTPLLAAPALAAAAAGRRRDRLPPGRQPDPLPHRPSLRARGLQDHRRRAVPAARPRRAGHGGGADRLWRAAVRHPQGLPEVPRARAARAAAAHGGGGAGVPRAAGRGRASCRPSRCRRRRAWPPAS